ncbi:Protein of unknown function [Alteromonadaceae bacterium Bs31]|nr:Protein of unknown function [Alteromonadaceae bacterium Bs31]
MKKYRFKNTVVKSLVIIILANFSLVAHGEQSASAIMLKVDERYTGDTIRSNATLILIDKKDRQRVRELTLFGIENEEVEKSIIYFRSPSDVKNTAYMSFDWKDKAKEDDSWLYLPALQKVRRVAASDESGAFMGSDFSYADINGLEYDDFEYSMEKASEKVDGYDCWVIKSLPKNDKAIKETGYTSSISWVRKDAMLVVKSIINVKRGKRTKYFIAKDIEKIEGIWTAQTLQMVTTKNGKREHSSVFKIRNVKYNQDVDESMFDTDAMQRGL